MSDSLGPFISETIKFGAFAVVLTLTIALMENAIPETVETVYEFTAVLVSAGVAGYGTHRLLNKIEVMVDV